ncbi:c-type cytochrome [Paracoccus luteus]|uniref:c-type cytochrome n=1 Tax=Paracoccus luteus TaxID=2508543 RepID=UPI00107064BE|nr:cytochrome c [Paracoccus luteus]
MRLTLAAALALMPIAAIAQDDPRLDAVAARQGYFKLLGANMGVLAGMAKGDLAYDEAQATQAGANIKALSLYHAPVHFAQGTSTDDLGDQTAARPEIWTDSAGFAEKFAGLAAAAAPLPEALAGGQDSLGPVVQSLGGACKACHDGYRAK